MVNRIEQSQEEEGILIRIKAFREDTKQKNLLVWIFAWTFCGLAIGSQLFVDGNPQLRSMLLIFIAFWAYFEFKVIKAYRWRQYGEERILIRKDQLQYGRFISDRGLYRPFNLSQLNPVRELKDESNALVKSFSDSYWVIGGEKLAFSYQAKVFAFGLRLTDKDTKKLMKLLNSKINYES